jgi:hypothetical protein
MLLIGNEIPSLHGAVKNKMTQTKTDLIKEVDDTTNICVDTVSISRDFRNGYKYFIDTRDDFIPCNLEGFISNKAISTLITSTKIIFNFDHPYVIPAFSNRCLKITDYNGFGVIFFNTSSRRLFFNNKSFTNDVSTAVTIEYNRKTDLR